VDSRNNKTRRFEVTPCVMLVALDDADASLCANLVKPLSAPNPVSVMRVAHIRGACERMLVTRPLIVVYSEVLRLGDQALLRERAEDIMAEVVVLPRIIDPDALKQALLHALVQANLKLG
jgi:hypothetical protein